MRPDTAVTLQNMQYENQDLHASFRYEMNTVLILQVMQSENQDLYLHFRYETRH